MDTVHNFFCVIADNNKAISMLQLNHFFIDIDIVNGGQYYINMIKNIPKKVEFKLVVGREAVEHHYQSKPSTHLNQHSSSIHSVMTCSFILSNEGTKYELFAEKVGETHMLETWRVSSKLDKNAFIVLSNDRPLLHTKHRYAAHYKWTVLEGDPLYKKIVPQITTYLEYYIKGLWQPSKKGKETQKPVEGNPQGQLF